MKVRTLYINRVLTASLLLLMTITVPAADGNRGLAGFYKLTDETDSGEEVTVTVKFSISNFGDTEVNNATVKLEDSVDTGIVYGSFTDVDLEKGRKVRLHKQFTISKSEYDRWHGGGGPRVYAEYTYENGNTARRFVELARTFIEED